ncbi:hypothetical protein J31TS3_17850 [Paenibacillus lactis]|nr:hypothetical protein J31TS3_17850 [Paenibacillus lactis]
MVIFTDQPRFRFKKVYPDRNIPSRFAQQARKQEKTPPEIKGCFTYVVTEIVEQLD